jgi:DNA-binding MarR family transcriptional regulator
MARHPDHRGCTLPCVSSEQTVESSDASEPPKELSVVYSVGRLDRVVRSAIDQIVREHGVSVAQYTVLSVLSHRNDLSNAQLARRSYVSPQSMMEVLKSLEELGLVKRRDDPNHGRIRQTRLTPAGKRLLQKCDAKVTEIEQDMTRGFTSRESQLFRRLIVRAVQNLGGGFPNT